MKLRNKKTGEIADLSDGFIRDANNGSKIQIKPEAISNKDGYFYNSLAELNAEWEDVLEEPIQVYLEGIQEVHSGGNRVFIDYATEKEAELAVRKLKAWKRLKDSKIKFCLDFVINKIVFTYVIGKNTIVDVVDAERQIFEDMKIIFGGEE